MQTLVNNKNGSIKGVNRASLYRYPYYLLTQPGTNQASAPNTVVVPSNQSSLPVALTVSGEGPMIVKGIALEDTNGGTFPQSTLMTMHIQAGNTSLALMSSPIRVELAVGSFMVTTGVQSGFFMFPSPILLKEGECLVLRVVNPFTATTSYRLSLIGARYTRKQYQKFKTEFSNTALPYYYTFNPDNPTNNVEIGSVEIAAAATVTQQINISSDSHFKLTHIMFLTSTAGDTLAINITDDNTGESLFVAPANTNFAINKDIFSGGALYPSVLPHPWFIKAGSKISITATNSGVATSFLYVALAGRLIPKLDWE